MHFPTIPTLHRSQPIPRKFCFLYPFMYFSSSCAIRTVDFTEESNTQELDFAELKRRMQNYAYSGCVQEALETLDSMRCIRGKPSVYNYNSFIYCYLKSRNVKVEEVFELYLGMKRFGPYPNSLTFKTLLNGMLPLGKLQHAVFIAKEMCLSGFTPSYSLLLKTFKRSLELGNLVDSFDILEVMLNLEYFPTERTLHLLISMLCRAGMIRKAFSVFSDLLGRGCFGSAYPCNPILWALCKAGQSYTALVLFCLMKKKGIVPNECSYTALVYGFSREGLWEEAFHCISEMKIDGCKPNVRTYTTIIKFLCDYGRIEEARGLLVEMENEGCDPDLVTYNIVLRELSRQYRERDIIALIGDIDQKGFSPNPYTHTALAGGLLKAGKIETVKELLLDTISKSSGENGESSEIDVAVYNIYFHSLCRENRSEEALSHLRSMIESGFRPNNVSYNTILNGYCRENRIDEALELFDHFDWIANGPDLVSLNTILSAACKQGNYSMVQRVLYHMGYNDAKPNVVNSKFSIQYFRTVKKISVLKPLGSILRNSPAPNIVTVNILLNNLCKNGLLGIAHQVFRDFRDNGIFLDTTSYNILIHASIRKGNKSLLDQLLRDMYSQRLKPDVFTYASFIKGFCKEGKISVALQLRDEMLQNGLTPSIAIYNTILWAIFQRGKFWDIVSLLKDMIMDGCEPNIVSTEILNQAKSKVVNNASVDLDESDCTSSSACLKVSAEALLQPSHRKRKHATTIGSLEEQHERVRSQAGVPNNYPTTLTSVKIAALEALEALLTVGGASRSECLRTNVDFLLITVATSACKAGWADEETDIFLLDKHASCWANFQLVSLRALLASLLSPARVCPPYLAQGLELFRRGKQQTGTRLAAFCAYALLALEVLIHPRARSLADFPSAKHNSFDGVSHKFSGSVYSGSQKHIPFSSGTLGMGLGDLNPDDDHLYNSWLGNSDENEVLGADLGNNSNYADNVRDPSTEKLLSVDGNADEIMVESQQSEKTNSHERVMGPAAGGSTDAVTEIGRVTDVGALDPMDSEIASGKDITMTKDDRFATIGENTSTVTSNLVKGKEIELDHESSMDSFPDIIDVDPDSE
ncbi:hypothetical protein L1049_012235 [Liquidambar formosana]|uniref:Pentatricopeptide repeat-containing protein n=1 Tax=Liquidambar formosana TaxID=63359 RepID=A0AAP0RSW1_LIQFO